jgi:hypothetical protein
VAVEITIAPSNSIILIVGAKKYEVPSSMKGAVIATTLSCVAIGSLSEIDGQTSITLEKSCESERDFAPSFTGFIETPSCLVEVKTVLGQTLLQMPVLHKMTKIAIWTNDKFEPDKIIIGVE